MSRECKIEIADESTASGGGTVKRNAKEVEYRGQ
jgi:hypothetical protein